MPCICGKSSGHIQIGKGNLLKAEADSPEGRQRSFGNFKRGFDRLTKEQKYVFAPDFIGFIKEQKNIGKSWTEISSLVLERYGISVDTEQLKSLSR